VQIKNRAGKAIPDAFKVIPEGCKLNNYQRNSIQNPKLARAASETGITGW
jgi:hypothetical protein